MCGRSYVEFNGNISLGFGFSGGYIMIDDDEYGVNWKKFQKHKKNGTTDEYNKTQKENCNTIKSKLSKYSKEDLIYIMIKLVENGSED